MVQAGRKAQRETNSTAYRELVRGLASVSDVLAPTPAGIYDCLTKAHLSEKHAVSTMLSREELSREAPEAGVPDELSDKAIAGHFANAAGFYSAAAMDSVATGDLPRAFKYYRKAAIHARRAAALQTPCDAKLLEQVREYKGKAVIVRQEIARRTVLRKRFSLGILKRRR
jgi:hypothetical protein